MSIVSAVEKNGGMIIDTKIEFGFAPKKFSSNCICNILPGNDWVTVGGGPNLMLWQETTSLITGGELIWDFLVDY